MTRPDENPARFRLKAESKALEREADAVLNELKQLPRRLYDELAELLLGRISVKRALLMRHVYRAYTLAPLSKKERKKTLALLKASWLADGIDPQWIKSGIRAHTTGDDSDLLNLLQLIECLEHAKRAQLAEPATHEQRLHLIELIKARAERLAKRPRLVT